MQPLDDDDGPFTVEDFAVLRDLVVGSWAASIDRDWSVPAGTLEWSCWTTADHTIDCVFSYALFLASRAQERYPRFGELHAEPNATPADLVEGLLAVTNMLIAVIDATPAGTLAIIRQRPPTVAPPHDFAARGAHEMILHAYDIACGLGVTLRPDDDVCRRLRDHTASWGYGPDITPTADAWSDLLERSGRPRVAG